MLQTLFFTFEGRSYRARLSYDWITITQTVLLELDQPVQGQSRLFLYFNRNKQAWRLLQDIPGLCEVLLSRLDRSLKINGVMQTVA